MVNANGIATAMMLEQHYAATIANLLNSDEPESVNSLSPFVHAQWYGVCVDEGTGTVKCDTQAQNRAAEKLLALFGLNPEHPNGELSTCFDEDVTDEQVSDMVERITKVAAETKWILSS